MDEKKKKRVSRFTPGELKKVGVEIINQARVHLKCMKCGQLWSPNIQPGGTLPRGYWKCPNGCNSE